MFKFLKNEHYALRFTYLKLYPYIISYGVLTLTVEFTRSRNRKFVIKMIDFVNFGLVY